MSRRDDATSLRQMLDHAREIVALTRNKSLADVQNDRMLELSLLHLLSVVGEAARRVSPAFRDAHPEIAWREITATRNWLIHVYDDVNLGTVWRTATEDIPSLIATLERLVR
jgi:uncharacterized protein with HEPN domain